MLYILLIMPINFAVTINILLIVSALKINHVVNFRHAMSLSNTNLSVLLRTHQTKMLDIAVGELGM